MKRILKSQLSKYNPIVILLFVYSLGIAQNFQDTKGELTVKRIKLLFSIYPEVFHLLQLKLVKH